LSPQPVAGCCAHPWQGLEIKTKNPRNGSKNPYECKKDNFPASIYWLYRWGEYRKNGNVRQDKSFFKTWYFKPIGPDKGFLR
jgi:hypothetical protein